MWIRTKEEPGSVQLVAIHPQLGKQQVKFEIAPASPEVV